MTPRPAIEPGAHGKVFTHKETRAGRTGWRAQTRYRPADGGLPKIVEAVGRTEALAQSALLQKIAITNSGIEDDGAAAITAQMTVADLLRRWLARERSLGTLSDQSISHYEQVAKTHLIEGARRERNGGELIPFKGAPRAIGHDRVGTVDAVRVERVLAFIAQATPGQLKPAATVLRQAFEWALREGAVTENPVRRGVRRVRRSKAARIARKRIATAAEITAFREAAVAHQAKPRTAQYVVDLVDVLTGSGLRVSEALALWVEDIEFDTDEDGNLGATAAILATMVELPGEGVKRQEEVKSRQSARRAPIVGVGAVALRRLVTVAEREGRTYLFVSRTGEPMGRRQVDKVWKTVADAAKLNHEDVAGFTPHAIRRAAGTAVARVHGIEAAARFLGNTKDVATEHYIDQHLIEVGDVAGALRGLVPQEDASRADAKPLSDEEYDALFGDAED
ncbi:tyrosine-type recombinase/integrase [Microbacterium aurum]|uniref:tyrosine-type recombinase/integrase n=1 Tax=Microbacterium aurum TaxID=36805 RepID=UPI00248F2899|nr:tyrosine-type recombinase/integrase [Microbacterium aurum]